MWYIFLHYFHLVNLLVGFFVWIYVKFDLFVDLMDEFPIEKRRRMGMTEFETHLQDSFKRFIKPFVVKKAQFGRVHILIGISTFLTLIASGIDFFLYIFYAVMFGKLGTKGYLIMILIDLPLQFMGLATLGWMLKTLLVDLRMILKSAN